MAYLSKKYLNILDNRKRSVFKNIQIKDSFPNIKKGDKFDIFLSYSYSDKDYALKIYKLLIECGFSVYVDL